MSYDLLRQAGVVVSFSTISNAVLDANYANVTTQGVVSYQVALAFEDITAKYQQLLPLIPGISVDFSKAEYVIITHTSGEREVLALAWIDENTIVSSSKVNKVIKMYDVPSTIDAKLTAALKLIPEIKQFTIETT